MKSRRRLWISFVIAAAWLLNLTLSGCGYVKNIRDDFLDIGSLAIGGSLPLSAPEKGEETIGGALPLGVYVQATDLLHIGALMKNSYDLEWDRRGLAVVHDDRSEFAFGPGHFVRIHQAPVIANAYKMETGELDGWRTYMRQWKGPITQTAAKELIFREKSEFLPYFYKGWRDWDGVSVELAVSDPLVLHSGIYVRAGVHPAQVFDALLSLFCLDFLYHDAAYHVIDGTPRF